VRVEEAPPPAAVEAEEPQLLATPVEIHAKGLGAPQAQQSLHYSAPTIDGAAGSGSVMMQSAPALGIGGEADGAQARPRTDATASASGGPSRNAPCPCGSGKKYKRCHGAPNAA
jgi:preprotein translocase subunit SecA